MRWKVWGETKKNFKQIFQKNHNFIFSDIESKSQFRIKQNGHLYQIKKVPNENSNHNEKRTNTEFFKKVFNSFRFLVSNWRWHFQLNKKKIHKINTRLQNFSFFPVKSVIRKKSDSRVSKSLQTILIQTINIKKRSNYIKILFLLTLLLLKNTPDPLISGNRIAAGWSLFTADTLLLAALVELSAPVAAVVDPPAVDDEEADATAAWISERFFLFFLPSFFSFLWIVKTINLMIDSES